MFLDVSSLSPAERYAALTQTVIPRPIAWVLTDNGAGEGLGRYNIAPFSFFNVVSATPPLLVLGISKKSDGSPKDTLLNLRERGKAVVHIAGADFAAAVWDSSVELPHGQSELLRLPHYQLESDMPEGCLPRVVGAPIALFCSFHHAYDVPDSQTSVVFCAVEHMYIDDAVLTSDVGAPLRVDAAAVAPLMRFGGENYAVVEAVLQGIRPVL